MNEEPPQIEHDADEFRPRIGIQLYKNERPHIWQEFKRDLHMQRSNDEPVIGRGWPIFVGILLIIAMQTYFAINGDPAWLIAIKSVF